MQDIDGKTIYSTIQEIIDPAHTALVVWDVQKMLVDFIFNKQEFIRNINFLIDAARKSKITIFYTTIEMLPLKYESSARLYTYTKLFASHQKPMQSPLEKRDLSLKIGLKDDFQLLVFNCFIKKKLMNILQLAGVRIRGKIR